MLLSSPSRRNFLIAVSVGFCAAVLNRSVSAEPLLVIVVVLPSDRNPFWIDVQKGAQQAARELGDKFSVRIIASKDQDAQNQTQILSSNLARNDVSALVIGPASDSETIPILDLYIKKGIPVVDIDTPLNDKEMLKRRISVSSFIGSNNVEGGRVAAQVMSAGFGEGTGKKVLILEGSTVHQSALDRTAGFEKEASSLGMGVTIINADWRRDRAREIVTAQLSRNKFDGIFACNDDMAMGAIAGLKDLSIKIRSSQWPLVIGFDATSDALRAIANDEMYASIKQDAQRMGREGVHLAARILLHDSTVPSTALLSISIVKK